MQCPKHALLWGHDCRQEWSTAESGSELGHTPLLARPRVLGLIQSYGVYPCSDGLLIIASANQSQFVALCKALGHSEWATDPRFTDNGGRMAHQEVLYELFSEVLKTRTRSDWEELFMEVGVPAGPINNYQQALDHPMAKHQKTQLSLKHPLGVEAPGIASPLKFSKTPVTYRRPPPMLGQHTSEVLHEMGLDQAEIDQLVKSGAIRP